jgi:hypothetical protein
VILSLGSHASTSYPFGTGRLASLCLTRYTSLTNMRHFRSNKHLRKLVLQVNFSSFDFLDEHHILYAISTKTAYTYTTCAVVSSSRSNHRRKRKKRSGLCVFIWLSHLNADEHRAAASLGYGPSRKHGHAPGGYNVTSGEWKLLLVLLVIASAVRLFCISKPDSVVCVISFL